MTTDVLEEPSVELVLPRDLDVRHQRWDGQDIGTRAPLLPRDADTLGVGMGDFRNLHRRSLSRRAECRWRRARSRFGSDAWSSSPDDVADDGTMPRDSPRPL